MGMTQSQVSWINNQKQHQELQARSEVTYARGQHQQVTGYPQQHSVQPDSDPASSISEFSSPVPTPQPPQGYYHHPQQQQHPQGIPQGHPQQGQFYGGALLDDNQYLDEASSDVSSHQGF